MIKQTIFIANPAALSLKLNQMVIQLHGSDESYTRPIEDIGTIVIEHQQTSLTMPLLNALADNNVAVVVCNSKCMPNAMLMPLEANATQQETYRLQIEATQPTKKRLWKEIVEHKIRNQSAALHALHLNGDKLKPFYKNVLSGDSDNREGLAAKIYWQLIYSSAFRRDDDSHPVNALLNYGYSLLRAATARALMGSGLFPAFGLFHRNRYNAFPLADDVMEPYRPFVDILAFQLYEQNHDVVLDKDVKRQLLGILTSDVKYGKQTRPLQIALTLTTSSIVKALKDNKQHIIYPEVICQKTD